MKLEKKFSADALRDYIMAAMLLSDNNGKIPFCDMIECAIDAKNAILDAMKTYDARIVVSALEYDDDAFLVGVLISDDTCTSYYTKVQGKPKFKQIIIETRRHDVHDSVGDVIFSNILSY